MLVIRPNREIEQRARRRRPAAAVYGVLRAAGNERHHHRGAVDIRYRSVYAAEAGAAESG